MVCKAMLFNWTIWGFAVWKLVIKVLCKALLAITSWALTHNEYITMLLTIVWSCLIVVSYEMNQFCSISFVSYMAAISSNSPDIWDHQDLFLYTDAISSVYQWVSARKT